MVIEIIFQFQSKYGTPDLIIVTTTNKEYQLPLWNDGSIEFSAFVKPSSTIPFCSAYSVANRQSQNLVLLTKTKPDCIGHFPFTQKPTPILQMNRLKK
jgi:hypothetical protein